MDALFYFLKSPDDEMRFCAFRLIQSVCTTKWGVVALNECGGLFEYLTDRNSADIMLGFEWKYFCLETLFKNEATKNVLDATHKKQLQTYLEQGVVFKSNGKNNKNKQNETIVQLGWENR